MLLNAILFILSMSVAGLLGYWAQDRDDPVTFHTVTAINEDVAPGGTLRVQVEATRHRNCTVHIEHVLFDGKNGRFALPKDDFVIDPGPLGKDKYQLVVPVPRSFSGGEARYRANRAYYCNPLQRLFDWPIVVPSYESLSDVLFQVVGSPVPTPVEILKSPGVSEYDAQEARDGPGIGERR